MKFVSKHTQKVKFLFCFNYDIWGKDGSNMGVEFLHRNMIKEKYFLFENKLTRKYVAGDINCNLI